MVQTIYDINKVHGGDIKVESKEVEGTSFIITIPITNLKYINEIFQTHHLFSFNSPVKAHGGELKVETREGNGPAFIIK